MTSNKIAFADTGSFSFLCLCFFFYDFQVFPRGSSLTSDVSRAMVTLKDNGEMKKMEDEWFGRQRSQLVVTQSLIDLTLIVSKACS